MKSTPLNPSQAAPARWTRVDSFKASPVSIGDQEVHFEQCASDLANALTQSLVNFLPRRFIVRDPPGGETLFLRGTVLSFDAHPLGRAKFAITIEFGLEAITHNGMLLAITSGKTKPQKVTSPPVDPAQLFQLLRNSIDKALDDRLNELIAKPGLNQAPWQARVQRLEGDYIVIDAGRDSNLAEGNLLDIYRPLEGQPEVSQYVATVEVATEGPNAAGCYYFQAAKEAAQVGDVVFIHYLNYQRLGLLAPTAARTTYAFQSLTIYTGPAARSGVRATAAVVIATATGSSVASIHFCDADKLAKFHDDVGTVAGGPWSFYLPIELMDSVLKVLRTEPNCFVSYTWSNPGGGGTPIGQIGFGVSRVEMFAGGNKKRSTSGKRAPRHR